MRTGAHSNNMFLSWFLVVSVAASALATAVPSKAPRIPLNDGNAIPYMGLGTFLGFDQSGLKPVKTGEVESVVQWAIEAGYRLLDTASLYHNEEQVGRGVAQSKVSREDIFVVTKLGSTEHRDVKDALTNSLKRLNMSYVDLYLMHTPFAFEADEVTIDLIDYVDTWKEMEKLKKMGLAKSIGISNFNVSQIERLIKNTEIKPAVLQVEVNLDLAQTELIRYCKENNIVVMAYTPFGGLFEKDAASTVTKSDNKVLVEIAKKYNKSPAQIALRYLVQLGVVPIPKSVRKEKIGENINIFDFEIAEEDMSTLKKFNKNHRTVHPSFWQNHPYYPFEHVAVAGANPFKP